MVGILALREKIYDRERYESPALGIGETWKTGGKNILVECVPLTWDEWQNPTEEMKHEMSLLPTREMQEKLGGYRITFRDVFGKVKRQTPHPCCLIDGRCTPDMVFDALLRSIRYYEKYPNWIPDAKFLRDSWVRNGVYVGIERENYENPLMSAMLAAIGCPDGRIIPNNLYACRGYAAPLHY